MKIQELSVGDWVIVDDCDKTLTKRVSAIDGTRNQVGIVKNNRGGIYWYCDDEIQPIPITTEILEQNGFTRWERGSNKGDYYLDIPRTKRVWLYYDFGVYKMAYIRNTGGCETFFKCRDIASVHQLQHALRLAGVEKEIEL